MRLHTDEEIESFDEITLIDMLRKKTFPSKKVFHWQNRIYKICYKNMREQDILCSGMMVLVSQNMVILWHYQSEHGYLQNIQSIVEMSYIYLLARCPMDDHQLL